MSEAEKKAGKKIYEEPSLRVYGDIRILTQSISMHATIADAMIPRKTA